MKTHRQTLNLVTDTGANASGVSGRFFGELKQIGYAPGDTGTILDTGAVLTLVADTGRLNATIFQSHLAPATGWVRRVALPEYDTGSIVDWEPAVFAGEKLTATVTSDLATDTGKDATVFLWGCE